MWDSTPWFVGGGAQHSPEVARLLAYAATGGAEGTVGATDLKVAPLATPGASVRVLIGACVVLNRNTSGAQQSYVARNVSEDVKGIAATGSGSGRNDLVIAQIKDPFLPGEPWADPADVTVGPYVFTEVVPNVPLAATASNLAATAHLRSLGISGIPLAAVLLPANTGTITSGLIKDLRKLARPRRETFQERYDAPDPSLVDTTATNGTFYRWPSNIPLASIPVPEWATKALIRVDLTGVQVRTGPLAAHLRYKVTGGSPSVTVYSRSTYINEQAANASRLSYLMSSPVDIPAGLRGQTAQGNIEVSRIVGSTGLIRAEGDAQASVEITFIEAAE